MGSVVAGVVTGAPVASGSALTVVVTTETGSVDVVCSRGGSVVVGLLPPPQAALTASAPRRTNLVVRIYEQYRQITTLLVEMRAAIELSPVAHCP
jgi:hypothetical protein